MALTTNLVAYWKFDESSGNAADATGNGNTATNTNSATFTTGKINNCAALAQASNQYFAAPSATSLNFTSDFTLAGWFYFTATNVEYALISRGWDGAQAGHNYWFIYNGNNTLSLLVSNGTTEHAPTLAWTPSSATWYHLAMVYSASAGSVSVYVNGSQQGSTLTGFPTTVNNTSKATCIGTLLSSSGGNDGISLDGRVDEVGIWSRALSSTEISQLYNGGSGIQYPFGTAWTKTLTESVSNTDSLVYLSGHILSEAISNTDTLLRSTVRKFTETISNTDTLLRTTLRVLLEAITNTDSISRIIARTFLETTASQGPLGGGTAANDATITGTVWQNTSYALSNDNNSAFFSTGGP